MYFCDQDEIFASDFSIFNREAFTLEDLLFVDWFEVVTFR